MHDSPGTPRLAKNDRMKSGVPSTEPVSPITRHSIWSATAPRQRSRFTIFFMIMLRQIRLGSFIAQSRGADGIAMIAPSVRDRKKSPTGRCRLHSYRESGTPAHAIYNKCQPTHVVVTMIQ
jgi:hypothetical protein